MDQVKIVAARQTGAKPLRHVFTISVLIVCFLLLKPQLAGVSMDEVSQTFARINPLTWAAALVATICSFLALGVYDTLIHRWLGTGVATSRAALSGAAGIAVSQTIGFGLLSGTIARARLLPELPLWHVARVTLAVGFSFLAAFAVVLALAFSILPRPEMIPVWVLPVGFAVAILVPLLSLWNPGWLPVGLPSLAVFGAVILATALDVGFAALAFWLLLPESAGLGFSILAPAFLVALVAGVVSGTPGGVGPFEITLLALLPFAPEADLLCAILAFRIVYYAVPAALAGAFLAIGPRVMRQTSPATVPAPGPVVRAEAGLTRQGEMDLVRMGPATLLTAKTAQCMVAVGPRVDGGTLTGPARCAFVGTARRAGLVPALYKCDARSAVLARTDGWRTVHIADELWLDPQGFDLAAPSQRRLRRKLRAAEKAGLRVSIATAPLPMADMKDVAAAWADTRGGERGFSMGRFDPDYVAGQEVILAHNGDRLVGFATFHAAAQEWVLDLIRFDDTAPDGTTFALIAAAIEAARSRSVTRFSLAAVQAGLAQTIAARLKMKDGLAQFKRAFSPVAEPRYLAARSWVGLALAAADITRRIHHPVPLPSEQGQLRPDPLGHREKIAA